MTKKHPANIIPRSKKEPHLDDLEISLAIYILKNYSSSECTFNAKEIATFISSITDNNHIDKTIRRKLSAMVSLYDQYMNDYIGADSVFNVDECLSENIQDALIQTYGGKICAVVNGKGLRYYFEPVLTNSDIDMLQGIVTSNKHLTDEVKNYLNSRLALLNTSDSHTENLDSLHSKINNIEALRDRPNSVILNVINTLYSCISNKNQVELTYGGYIASGNGKPEFTSNGKTYQLNPYAMLWNHGHYYLIATLDNHSQVRHYRIDRILSATKLTNKRSPLPPNLRSFFKRDKDSEVFQPVKYTSTFPLMSIYEAPNLINCKLKCESGALSYIVDTVGTNVLVTPSSDNTFTVSIKNVQYESIRLMCVQQNSWITPVAPEILVNEVKEILLNSLSKF